MIRSCYRQLLFQTFQRLQSFFLFPSLQREQAPCTRKHKAIALWMIEKIRFHHDQIRRR